MVEGTAPYGGIPIPSYEEAIAGRTVSSDGREEREGLLSQNAPPGSSYRAPTVESDRSSIDSDLNLPEINQNGDEAQRVFEELDYLDPEPDTSRRSPRPYHRTRLRRKISQRWSDISATLSSIRIPSLRSFYTPVPSQTTEPAEASAESEPPTTWLTRLRQRQWITKEWRMSASTFARLCGLLTIVLMIYFLFAWDMFPGRGGGFGGARYDPESLRSYIQEHIDANNIKNYLHHITSYDHVAGTRGDLYMAEWMQEQWKQMGNLDTIALVPYFVYLNYPGKRSVNLVAPENKQWAAVLEEAQVYKDRQQTLSFHGHSKSGTAQGHLIYANSGSLSDFDLLRRNHVVTNGSIALVKYHGSQEDRGSKIKAAEDAGCVGVLMYSDPSDADPASPWHPPEDSVERGAVSMASRVMGDPSTPGSASILDAKRLSIDKSIGLPNIPSLPLSWKDARSLLKSLQGHGLKVDGSWVHGNADVSKEWYSGNVSSEHDHDVPVVRLENIMEDTPMQKIWNLHGIIEGVETPEKKIIIGNHRDSWCFGAVDPGSGTAVMMEIIRIFGQLRQVGWRPLRTIEFVSWDAEEYNMIGSTEYVEDKIANLRDNGVAYINVEAGVSGPHFQAGGAPVWERALQHALERVGDPNSNHTATVLKQWRDNSGRFDGLAGGSDYVAFQDIAGVSSVDLGFAGKPHSFPSHSCYETFEWMLEHGDPDFLYHHALAQIWALLILDISDSPIIPYNIRDYADKMQEYIKNLEDRVTEAFAQQNGRSKASMQDVQAATNFSTRPLYDAANLLRQNADQFHRWEDYWASNVLGTGGFETRSFTQQRILYNRRLADFETDLLDDQGIPGREQFKHVVYGPQLWNSYETAYFPAVQDMILAKDWDRAREMVDRSATRIREAAENLLRP